MAGNNDVGFPQGHHGAGVYRRRDLGGAAVSQRVLVCGGRDFTDRVQLYDILDRHHQTVGINLIIHGAARGADTLAWQWACDRILPDASFPADWKTHGKGAGLIRNTQMLTKGKPDLVIALPGGRGTADMVSKAKAAGVRVIEIPRKEKA